jgi:glycosyltransferase involved in cell wall biosynthesis
MEQLKLSIIIPVYNVEKYIGECLQSVYNQDISEEEFEVICVNDCSPDGSRDIVLEFQKRHSNLVLLQHKKRKLPGGARNSGLKMARGKYVYFIDSDDFIKENVFGKLLDIAETNKLEILEFNSQEYREGQLTDRYYLLSNSTDVITGMDYLNFEKISIQTWSKFFLKDFLIKNNLYFYESVICEDQIHSIASLLLATRYKFISEKIYFYRIHNNSIMSGPTVAGARKADVIYFCCGCMDLLDKHSDQAFLGKRINRYIDDIPHQFQSILDLPFKEKVVYCRRLFKFNRKIVKKYLPLKKRWYVTFPLLIFVYSILRKLYQYIR